MILDYLFLPVLFLIGLIISYQDFRYGKIKNKWIILGLAWGLIIYFFFLIWGIIAEPIIPFSYILKVFVNSFFALIVGYILWYFNLWSAGDAKLFFVFTLLLPLQYYWRTALPVFPSFALLINIFIPALLLLISQNIFYIFKNFFYSPQVEKENNQSAKEKFLKLKNKIKINYPNYLKIGFGFLLIFLIFKAIFVEFKNLFGQEINNGGNIQLMLPILVISFFIVIKIIKKFFFKRFSSDFFSGKILIVLFSIFAFYAAIKYFIYSQNIISEIFLLIKTSFWFLAILIIITLLASFGAKKTSASIPFAPLMLIGLIITIFLQGSLIIFLLRFLS